MGVLSYGIWLALGSLGSAPRGHCSWLLCAESEAWEEPPKVGSRQWVRFSTAGDRRHTEGQPHAGQREQSGSKRSFGGVEGAVLSTLGRKSADFRRPKKLGLAS